MPRSTKPREKFPDPRTVRRLQSATDALTLEAINELNLQLDVLRRAVEDIRRRVSDLEGR